MFIQACVLAVIFEYVSGTRPEVKIHDGKIRGIIMESFKGRPIFGFYNIPYTEELTQRRRFEELNDADSWEGVLDAGGPPVRCPQISLSNELVGVENCLFINVFTPFLPKSSLVDKVYPVVVYVHGGAYYFYSGSEYGPRYLLDKDVVLVTFNYRIGIPGFGSTADYILPGNLGLKDQLKALTWVQRNIDSFSGDKNCVTLLGMSSGAANVHFHYFSKESQGLFHRGVMIGGSATTFWAMTDQPRLKLAKISHNLGCPVNSSFDMVVCLENLPARELASGIRTVQGPGYLPIAPVSVIVDDFSSDPFLLDYPYDAIEDGRVANLPLLVSNAEFEGIFPGVVFTEDEDAISDIDSDWLTKGKYVLELDRVLNVLLNDTLMKIRKHYFGDMPISQDTDLAFIKMMSDRYFITHSVRAAILHARTNPQVYYYLFGYKGHQSTAERVSKYPDRYGASHVDDLFYMMNVTNKRTLEENATDVRMIERMTTMLASFAKTGVPDFGNKVEFRPLPSNASIHKPIAGLLIRSPDKMKMMDLDVGDVKFWDSLPIRKPRKIRTKITPLDTNDDDDGDEDN